MELSQMELNILLDALDTRGGFITPGMRSSNDLYDTLVDKGLLKKFVVQSGFTPKYGYRLTDEGYDVASYADYRRQRALYEKPNKSC